MIFKQVCLTAIVASCLFGCSSQSEVASAPASPVRGKPAFARIVNLTDSAVSASFASLYKDEIIEPQVMTGARPLSPDKEFSIDVVTGGKKTSGKFKTEQESFTTIIFDGKNINSFSSGSPLSMAGALKVDLINLTKETIPFSIAGKDVSVGPMNSETVNLTESSTKVSIPKLDSQSIDGGPLQVWGAFAYRKNGKLILKTVNLKGTGVAAGAGPSPS